MNAKSVRQQRGVVLIMALIVLTVMTVAAIGLVRSVDSGNLVAGNLAFRADTRAQADIGLTAAIDAAKVVFAAGSSASEADASTSGYYATPLTADGRGLPEILVNATRPSIPGQAVGTSGVGEVAVPLTTQGGGIVIRYVLERVCSVNGAASGLKCKTFTPPALSARSLGVREVTPDESAFVRASVRVDGPNNTISYIQAMVR
jgi:type IV pilus assembly protein PilX